MVTMLFRAKDRARVDRAATLLDADVPDWFTRVDLTRLSLASGEHCVLAQIYGGQHWWTRLFIFIWSSGYLRGLYRLSARGDYHGPVFAADMFYREYWITAILARRFAADDGDHGTQESQQAAQQILGRLALAEIAANPDARD